MEEENWEQWIERNWERIETKKTRYEILFVREILSQIPLLSPASVKPQTPFPDDYRDSTRLIDFTIEEGELVKIALEVDGWSKKPGQSGTDHAGFVDWSIRELYMTRDGWVPLRFANWLVENEPEMLRETITLQLTLRRNIAAMVKTGGESAKRAEAEKRELEDAAQAAIEGEAAARAKVRQLQAKIESEYLPASESARLSKLQGEIRRLNGELLKAKKEIRGMKVLGVALAVVAIVAIVAVVVILLTGGNDQSAPSLAMCEDATPVEEVTTADEGEGVTVKGEVVGARTTSSGTFLNLGEDYPDQDLAVVIWEDNVDNWPTTPPESKYDNKEIAVTGTLEVYEGSPQIEVNSPNDVAVCS